MHAIQRRVAVTEGCKCHSGDVLMKARHAQHERQLFCSPWRWLLLAGVLPTGLEGVQRKVHRESQMEKEQDLPSGPAIAKQMECLSICVALLLEDMRRRWLGGRKTGDSAGGRKEIQAASGCIESSIPDNSTASGAGLPSWPEMLSRWGAGSHPKREHGQVGEPGEEGVNTDQSAGGLHDTHLQIRLCPFSHPHAGEGCPAKRLSEVLEGGICHLPLLLGTPALLVELSGQMWFPPRVGEVNLKVTLRADVKAR